MKSALHMKTVLGAVFMLFLGLGMTVTANPLRVHQTAHGFVKGQPLRLDVATGKYALAQADTEDHARVVGVANTFITPDYFILSQPDEELLRMVNLVVGTVYYLSPTTPGAVTTTKPSSFIREVYQATAVDRAKVLLNYIAAGASSTAESSEALTEHINDDTDAHDASAISFNPDGGVSSFNVQDAIVEVDAQITAETAARVADVNSEEAARIAADIVLADAISDHLADTIAAHDASSILNIPSGTIAATDVQGALNELDTEKATTGSVAAVAGDLAAHIADATDAHAATAITNTPAGTIAATTVQAAINELDGDMVAHVAAADPHTGYQKETEKGNANGYASLDGGGKVPAAQLPNSIMQYQGMWDASSNTPTLANGAGNADVDIGDVYKVSASGSVDFGAGSISFVTGDYVILNASKIWEKSDTTDAVSSIFGRTGAVSAASGDYTASQVTNVPAGTIAAITVQAALNELDTEKATTGSVTTVSNDLAAHLADTTAAHAASAISNTAAGTIAATTVQAAIDELDNEIIYQRFLHRSVHHAPIGTYLNIASPGSTVNGVTISLGQRILEHLQPDSVDNGIYIWNGAAVPMTRATDWASGSSIQVRPGTLIVVDPTYAFSDAKGMLFIVDDWEGETLTIGTNSIYPIIVGNLSYMYGRLSGLDKLPRLSSHRFLGNNTAGTADVIEMTIAEAKAELNLTGTNSGDQTSIVGITGTLAQFNTAVSDADLGALAKAAGTSIAAGPDQTWLVLSGNSSDITGTSLTTVMTVTDVGAGRYKLICQLVYQTTNTGTGIDVAVNHTGTTTQWIMEHRFSSTGQLAGTAAASEAAANAAGNLYESQGNRTKNAIIGAGTVSVDSLNTDMLSTIEGFFVVSVTGSLEIKLAAESAALVCRAMQGSNLQLLKLS